MKRNEIAEEYKWDLGHIYPSRLDWENPGNLGYFENRNTLYAEK